MPRACYGNPKFNQSIATYITTTNTGISVEKRYNFFTFIQDNFSRRFVFADNDRVYLIYAVAAENN